METDLISIIVPVYNVEEYIEVCVSSLINQSYRNIEILLIDDGSTDQSYKMCIEFSEKDSRIKVYHKENGGVSSARNFGLNHALGAYIAFVDPDDYVEKDMYSKMYKNIIDKQTDAAMCNFNKIKNDSAIEQICPFSSDVVRGSEILKKIYAYQTMGVLWNKLFSRKIINCKFDEKVHFCEDVLFLT